LYDLDVTKDVPLLCERVEDELAVLSDCNERTTKARDAIRCDDSAVL
jgi:hypothetical protein